MADGATNSPGRNPYVSEIVNMTSFMQGLNTNGTDAYTARNILGANWGYRQPSTAYTLGDIVYINSLTYEKKLVCVSAGTSASGDLTVSDETEGALVTDGTVTWIVDSLADGIYDAAHQNSIFRGADLTAYHDSGLMSTNIRAGKFIGMHIGDHVVKSVTTAETTYTDKAGTEVTQAAATYSNVKWLLGGFDVHLYCGDGAGTTAHHVLLIPASTLQRNVKMNPTHSTDGAYVGSDMWTKHMPIWAAAIQEAFGSDHVLSHRELLANAISTSAPSGAGAGWGGSSTSSVWTSVLVNIPDEPMIYGGRVFSSSGFDIGDFSRQLPLYALKCNHLYDRSWFWLRAVASEANFCAAYSFGTAAVDGAAASSSFNGIRPYFLYN